MTTDIARLVDELLARVARYDTETARLLHLRLEAQARELAEATLQAEANRQAAKEMEAMKDEALRAERAAQSRIAALEEALRPFVHACPHDIVPDAIPMSCSGPGENWEPTLFVRDFRRARTALNGEPR